MTEERAARIREVAAKRQFDLTVVLENVHDPHNISAVLRSCDAVGLREVYVLYTEERLQDQHRLKLGKKTSGGAVKWVKIHYFTDRQACFKAVRKRYQQLWATHLGKDARSLYELDFTRNTHALVFGNEHDGLSEEALQHCTGNIQIPTQGMVGSLNISVACAVSLFEAMRQKLGADHYGKHNPAAASDRQALLREYFSIHESRRTPRTVYRKKKD